MHFCSSQALVRSRKMVLLILFILASHQVPHSFGVPGYDYCSIMVRW